MDDDGTYLFLAILIIVLILMSCGVLCYIYIGPIGMIFYCIILSLIIYYVELK